MRVYAVVEGDSEERFLKSVVGPHLASCSVFLFPMKVLRGGGARGGGRSWQPWRRHLHGLLAQHSGADVRVTTMFDLFRVPTDIPGYTEAGNKNGPTRADAIQVAVAAEHSDWRLVPYVQVYEFETLLFTDLGVLAREAADIVDAEAFDSLREATRDVPPEEINDGPSTAPSRRIEACTWGFRKTIHGIQTVAALGLDNLKVRCPRFGNWLSELESLGEITI